MNTDQLDREQAQVNDAVYAKALKENPFFQKLMITLKAQNFERIGKIRKGKDYEKELKDEHDTLQNLMRIENTIEKAIADGKITEEKRKRRSLLSK